MDLLPTPEQDEIITTVRAQLDQQFGLHALADRDGADQVVSPELWRRCAERGWFGLGLEESLGGVGYTVVEEALLVMLAVDVAEQGRQIAQYAGGDEAAGREGA